MPRRLIVIPAVALALGAASAGLSWSQRAEELGRAARSTLQSTTVERSTLGLPTYARLLYALVSELTRAAPHVRVDFLESGRVLARAPLWDSGPPRCRLCALSSTESALPGIEPPVMARITVALPLWDQRATETFLALLAVAAAVSAAITLARRRAREETRVETERARAAAEAQAHLSAQVAHDIRSPLAALEMVSRQLPQIGEEKRVLLRNALGRIRDIANQLLERRESAQVAPADAAVQLLPSIVETLVSEKRLEFRARLGLDIEDEWDARSYGASARVVSIELKRVLSNLINNAVEAIPGAGRVMVRVTADAAGIVIISVEDSGRGISPELLPRLARRGESHGKEGGTGIGLYHARSTVESWGGRLEIESAVGSGTVVRLCLPRTEPPVWLQPELRLEAPSRVIVVDDDSTIHQIWKGRFESLRMSERGVQASHFTTPGELRAFAGSAEAERILYLVDYEFLGASESGIELISGLGIAGQSVLVTSRFEEDAVRAECLRVGVRLIPKGMAGFVPIAVSAPCVELVRGPARKLDAVLIDDDPLVRMSWNMSARNQGRSVEAFATPEEFDGVAEGVDRATPVYVDAMLGAGVDGVAVSRRVHSLGFSSVFLATGLRAEQFEGNHWLSGVVGKDPPWG